jgi:hypothetical protein
MMKRFSSGLCAFLGLWLASQMAKADDDAAKLIKAGEDYCLANAKEVKDFSDYYNSVDIDWIAYYRSPGYPPKQRPNATCCWDSKSGGTQCIQFAPALKNSMMHWAGPTNSELNGPPANLSQGMMMMPH